MLKSSLRFTLILSIILVAWAMLELTFANCDFQSKCSIDHAFGFGPNGSHAFYYCNINLSWYSLYIKFISLSDIVSHFPRVMTDATHNLDLYIQAIMPPQTDGRNTKKY